MLCKILKQAFFSFFLLKQKKEIEETLKEGWEYSKLFSLKFHAKEQTSDTVRRRRWHRPMQPKISNSDFTTVFRFENNQVFII